MKRTNTCLVLLSLFMLAIGAAQAQNQVTYGFVQDPVDQLKLTAVAYPNFTSNNVTISTALFTFYLPAGTITSPAIPTLPAFGSFTDVTGVWRIEKITPALYASFGFNANDLQGNDIYQCILQNSPSPNTVNGQPVSLFSFRLPGDCMGGTVQVHTNNNSIQLALLNNVGININNQMSVSVNDAPAVDIYSGNNPTTYQYNCPLDDVPVAVDDIATTNEDQAVNINVTGNDNFGTDGPSSTAITITTPPAHGMASVDNNGTPNNPTDDKIIYTPNANYNGTDVVVYQICDADNDCDPATVSITINAVNDPPVANDDNATTPEDTPVTLAVTANDTDVDGTINLASLDLDPNTIGIQTTYPVGGGIFSYDGAGNVTFTPNANFNGTATVVYQVCDTGTPLPALCDLATVTVTVTPVNDLPVVPNTTVSTPEDTPINVCAPITDVDNSSFTVTSICTPDGGIVSGLTNPATSQYCLTYTPNLNYDGPDTLCIQVCDGSGGCDTSYVFITVTPVNDPPIANDDAATTPEDTPVTLNVTANDTDVDGAINPASLDLDPNTNGIQTTFTVAGGTFTYNGAGNVTFTPNLNFNGTAIAQYQVCDTGTPLPAQCDLATITITVTPVNDPPIANDDAATTPEDTPVTLNVTANDTDVDGAINPASLDLDPNTNGIQTTFTVAGGTFIYNGGGNVTFTPNANFNGTATAQYQVCDTGTPLPAQCDLATITITITPANDPPVVPNTTVSTPEDTPINVCVPITDVDNSSFTVTSICTPDGGVVSGLTNPATSQYCLTYTPNLNYNGPDTLCIQVCDGSGGCDTSYVFITVTPVNDPPIANDDAATTPEDTPVTLNVTANDTDVDGAINPASLDLDPNTNGIQTTFTVAGGTFTYNGAGNVTFTPNLNFNGTAIAQYQVCDTGTPLPAQCDLATITITVTPVNDPPIANDDAATTPEDTPVTLNVTANDTDVDGAINPASLDLDPNTNGIQTTFTVAGGTFTYNGGGNVTFTPNANFNGTATAQYQVCDTGTPLPAQCDLATITITITPVNDAPIANNDVATTPEDTPVPVPVLNNDSDIDGTLNPGSVSVINTPDHGTATVNNITGVVTYTPAPNFVGNDTLSYVVCDSGTPVLCDTANVYLTITATSVRLLGIMRLQGALYNNPDTLTLMRDNLRSLGRLPKKEPYSALPAFVQVGSGGEMVTDSATVFSNRGANSIVDWVFVELHDPNLLTHVVATRCALLQRDGNIVDMDGLSSVTFENVLPASYYVAVRHRNHLGTMTANAIALTNSGTVVDFTDLSTPLWDDGTNLNGLEQVTVHGKYALWAGNVNTNTSVVFAGQNNDKDPIFNEIDQAPGNFLHSQSYVFNGYHLGDVNLDGKAIFAGQTNDVDFIFNNVDSHPRNITRSQSFVIRQQLPQ